ncbi:MAG: PRC-barrel domain containing protein, partial [Chitinivibrionales bacterium]|nr:PRC-barrel domain containing protein [Chitinivibrionales bacterium]
MLYSINHILSLLVNAQDGPLGKTVDCYFDDRSWKIRYLVMDTGTLLPGRKVLISTAEIRGIEMIALNLGLTKEKIQQSPEIDHRLPISRQHEHDLRY